MQPTIWGCLSSTSSLTGQSSLEGRPGVSVSKFSMRLAALATATGLLMGVPATAEAASQSAAMSTVPADRVAAAASTQYYAGSYLYPTDCELAAEGYRRYGYSAGCALTGMRPDLPWDLWVWV
jgi:hypothetical protein